MPQTVHNAYARIWKSTVSRSPLRLTRQRTAASRGQQLMRQCLTMLLFLFVFLFKCPLTSGAPRAPGLVFISLSTEIALHYNLTVILLIS